MYYTIFLLAIHTGMRRGEFLGLRWQDIDLETGYINIEQSLVYDEDGFRFTEPKPKAHN
ncbi:tyrosine-type recombinase/integrase [Metabacillus sp. FJAT-53654]|uniref:Tyrosine-type recombinase/integrase n=1 Tax=Metabacillus rhizosphaerae TaxID=3117747 RepID=A0ABZ2MUT0_9BACI